MWFLVFIGYFTIWVLVSYRTYHVALDNGYITGGFAVVEEILKITLLAFILKHLSIQYCSAMALGTFLGVIFAWRQVVNAFKRLYS